MIKKRDLNELNFNDAESKLDDCYEKLQKLVFQKALQQIENPIEIKLIKKEIAQLKTILNEYNLGIRGEANSK